MASPSSIELGDEVLVQQDKTNKLSTAFNPFKVISKTGNILVVESQHSGNQYSRPQLFKRWITLSTG